MNKFVTLLKGDAIRMKKYGITYASLFTTALFIIMIQLINMDSIDKYFPLFIFIDATMMSFLLIGVSMIFEKQENTIKSMLVTSISKHDYLLSKIITTVSASILTLILLGVYGIVFKDLSINYIGIFGAVALISFVFSCFGILVTYLSKDFTNLLMWIFAYSMVGIIPTLLQAFNIINADWFKYIQYINPTQSALNVLNATVMTIDKTDFTISLSYLIILAVVLYVSAAKEFDKYSQKELGGE